MPFDPLLQLIRGNLADAQLIGILDSVDPKVAEFDSLLASTWRSATPNQLQEYERHMAIAQTRLATAYRPRQVFRGKTMSIFHVKPLSAFLRWAREIDGMPDRFGLEAQAGAPYTSTIDIVRATEACLRITQELGATSHSFRRGKLVRAESLQPNDRSFWIGRRRGVHLPNDADFWRDRLGLIHLQANSSGSVGDMLVRVELGVDLSTTVLQPDSWRDQVRVERNGFWLIRPTLTHFGNQRWVQAHPHDLHQHVPHKHGRTRDLRSPIFASGERELLVLFGFDTEAKFRFRGVELLNGLPSENAVRYNSDSNFVNVINRERGWR